MVFVLATLWCSPSFSAVASLAVCDNWSMAVWAYGPAGFDQATAGGITGVPYCLNAIGTTHVMPAFVTIDTADLTALLAEKPTIDYFVANYAGFQTAINNGLLTGHVLNNAEYAQFQALVSAAPPLPFDAVQASELWWGGFSFVLFLYITSYGVGGAIRLINGSAH